MECISQVLAHCKRRQRTKHWKKWNNYLTADYLIAMIKEDYKYSDITQQIIGCAMRVHSSLGCGFPESIYHRAMVIEMKDEGLNFESEKVIPVYYKNHQIGKRRVDFLVEGVVSVEIKAISELTDSNLNQGLNYLEAYNHEVGLLLNFGSRSLQFKRLINSKKSMKSNQGNQNII